MVKKHCPLDLNTIKKIMSTYPTPFYVYDEKSMCENGSALHAHFSWAPNFKNYFAVKAAPTPGLIRPLLDLGMGLDCSSLAELCIAERLGVSGEDIMFTSNNTPEKDMKKALELGAIINLDDISHIDFVNTIHGTMPELVCMRYNPGKLKSGNTIIGKPEEAKYGFTKSQLFEGYQKSKELGAKRFGLHTMVASNELNYEYFVETAQLLFELLVELKEKKGIRIELVNLGGGIGIPYAPDQDPVDIKKVSEGIKKLYDKIIIPAGLDPLSIKMENGRYITGPYGYLITQVIHEKDTYKHYIGVDACMANLMRPGMYGAYHHISVLGKTQNNATKTYDVVGGLCENNDKFAIDRELPEIEVGDILVIHDSGAHGHAMGFNYNGKLRSAELLWKKDQSIEMIRRAETVEDYFKTLMW